MKSNSDIIESDSDCNIEMFSVDPQRPRHDHLTGICLSKQCTKQDFCGRQGLSNWCINTRSFELLHAIWFLCWETVGLVSLPHWTITAKSHSLPRWFCLFDHTVSVCLIPLILFLPCMSYFFQLWDFELLYILRRLDGHGSCSFQKLAFSE